MQGSFENPPIIIRTSHTFSSVGAMICFALFCLGLAPVFLGKVPFRVGDHFISIAFGIGCLYFVWQLISPSSLVLAPDGLTWKTCYIARHWYWRDVSNFRVMSLGSVGCDLSDDRRAVSWLRGPNKALTGSQGSFGFGWEGGAATVVAALTAARLRWL